MAMIENSKGINCKTFCCFSPRLSHAIQCELGQFPINKFKHKDGKIANVFILTPTLSEFLREWSRNNPKGAKNG